VCNAQYGGSRCEIKFLSEDIFKSMENQWEHKTAFYVMTLVIILLVVTTLVMGVFIYRRLRRRCSEQSVVLADTPAVWTTVHNNSNTTGNGSTPTGNTPAGSTQRLMVVENI